MPETGSITIPLFHCLFNADGSVTHWTHAYDRRLYDLLEHHYLVCMADNSTASRKVIGAFMIKTSRHHSDEDFERVVHVTMGSMESLLPLWQSHVSFLPARLTLSGPAEPPTEDDFLHAVCQQYLKFSASGTA